MLIISLFYYLQIATACGNYTFDAYIMTSKKMSLEASDVTGIQIMNNEIYVNKKKSYNKLTKRWILWFFTFLKIVEAALYLGST